MRYKITGGRHGHIIEDTELDYASLPDSFFFIKPVSEGFDVANADPNVLERITELSRAAIERRRIALSKNE